MSVAFRRESDEEHLEPRFELPLPPGPNLVTPRGLRLLEAEVASREAASAAVVDQDARKAAARDLRYWRTRLATAEVAPAPTGAAATIGTRVRFRLASTERAVEIVGHDEAEPAAGRIAFASPLARALIGAEAGEALDFNGRADAIVVLAIEAIGDQP